MIKQKKWVIRGAMLRVVALLLVVTLTLTAVPVLAKPVASPRVFTVQIIRDDFGVPHVYSNELEGLFFGFGYAVAKDRLFQLEMTRRTSWGTVSEVLGSGFVAFDISTRRGGYTRAEIQSRIDALGKEYQTMLKAYADGINQRIKDVLANPARLLPREFHELGFVPSFWDAADVANVFVGTMAIRFSDLTAEISQAATLAWLIARYGEEQGKAMFSDIRWIEDPGAKTTIRAEDWPNCQSLAAVSGSVPDGVISVSRHVEKEVVAYNDALVALGLPISGSSNAFVLSGDKTATGEAILFGGPQMGWVIPAYLHEVGLHGAGFDVVGTTPVGSLAILFGHNKDIAFTSTAGLGNVVDIFVEQLHPEDPTRYLFNGEYLDMQKREETIKVRGAADVHVEFFRTVHGPVISVDRLAGVAYSRARTWENLELESLAGWIDASRATNWDEFWRASTRMAITISWFYADRSGNIGYVLTGRYPIRHPDQDPRLPTPGTGEREWLGFVPPQKVPHVYNPSSGYIANWNQQPAPKWPNPALMLWGKADRADVLSDWLEERLQQGHKFTVEDAKALNVYASFADVNERYFRPRLIDAARELQEQDPRLLEAAFLLEQWDGLRIDSNGDGFYDSPGQAIFQHWLTQMLRDTFRPWFGTMMDYSYPVGPFAASLNIPTGPRVLLHVLDGEDASVPMSRDYLGGLDPEQAMVNSLITALNTLTAAQGPDMNQWRVPITIQRFGPVNYAGVPQALVGPIEVIYMNRGSENHIVSLGRKGVVGINVNPPGQSGFVSLTGETTPHFSDQMGLYEQFRYKPMNFSANQVNRNATRRTILSYRPYR